MITILQTVALVVALFAVSRAFLRFKDRKLSLLALLFWLVIWAGVVVAAFVPTMLTWLSAQFGVQRGVDILVYGGIILLFYLIFRVYVKLETLDQQLTKTVRELALRKKKK